MIISASFIMARTSEISHPAQSGPSPDDISRARSSGPARQEEPGGHRERAEIMKKRSVENQTFYLVKFIFPRGDAASLLFGFDAEGKITGIGVESTAGD